MEGSLRVAPLQFVSCNEVAVDAAAASEKGTEGVEKAAEPAAASPKNPEL